MEANPAAPLVAASKLWNIIVRVVLFMLKKGIAKSKIKFDLNLLVKRGKIAAGKAIACSIMLHHHYAAFTCRSSDSHLTFISPSDYEFSCSNSPDLPFRAITNNNNKRKHHKPYRYDDVSAFSAFRKVLVDNPEVANSPLATLPGFGKSPIGRQLRITDSPSPDDDGDAQVDKAAEEFINKFYTDLSLQKRMAACSDSPYSNFWDR
ncbi:hypothetical protein QN277_000763 [Acacia crassicarpa]|uniref:Avr9/Cf-9 rapidly elicited protein n=1 Tax=Acacia crassicarpa TaxID=499986 RepID=A0AAE1N776_9FABA|nr:hypothetical protein QN277_000763 [Acacia crassicarpa]